MIQPGRKYSPSSSSGPYRYGFNGKENDNEIKGEGNQQDYGMRIYDPRLGKFLSVDPLMKNYPWYSPYHFAGNTPIQATDLDGGEIKGYRWSNPYVASHPGTGVKTIASRYDNEAVNASFDGGPKRPYNATAIQDIDGRLYVVYEAATGAIKDRWYYEYDKNGNWLGSPNQFTWSSVPNVTDALLWMTVAPLVGLPTIVTGGFLFAGALAGEGSELVLQLQYNAYKLFIRYAPTLGSLARTVAEFMDESDSVSIQNASLRKLAAAATRNTEKMTVMLGQYEAGKASSYERRAGEMFSYFELDHYKEIAKIAGSDKMWDINRQFIDDAIAAGKKFIFSHDPNQATGSFLKEVNYLKEKGFTEIKQLTDNTWEVQKK